MAIPVDYHDKLLSFYVRDWLVSGSGNRRTPSSDEPAAFWEQRAHRLIDSGMLVPSGLAGDLSRMTGADLKLLCASYGLRKSGKKSELVDRLLAGADATDLRAQCPGPYWVPSAEFQGILDTDADRVRYLDQHRPTGIDPVDVDCEASSMTEAQWHDLLWSRQEAAKLNAASRQDRTAVRAIMLDQCELLAREGRTADQFRLLVEVCSKDLSWSGTSVESDISSMLIGAAPVRTLAPGLVERMRRIHEDADDFHRSAAAALERCGTAASPFSGEEMLVLLEDAAFPGETRRTREVWRSCGERHRAALYALAEDAWDEIAWLLRCSIEAEQIEDWMTPDPSADPADERLAALDALERDVAGHRAG